MTYEEAREILGPELCAEIDARPAKPLSPEQIEILVGLLADEPDNAADSSAA